MKQSKSFSPIRRKDAAQSKERIFKRQSQRYLPCLPKGEQNFLVERNRPHGCGPKLSENRIAILGHFLRTQGCVRKKCLLRRAFFEIFALFYGLTFANLLLHHSADFKRQAEQCDKALGIVVVVQIAGRERSDALVVEAVF